MESSKKRPIEGKEFIPAKDPHEPPEESDFLDEDGDFDDEQYPQGASEDLIEQLGFNPDELFDEDGNPLPDIEDWKESDHPHGQPKNAGQFAKGAGKAAGKKKAAAKPAPKAVAKAKPLPNPDRCPCGRFISQSPLIQSRHHRCAACPNCHWKGSTARIKRRDGAICCPSCNTPLTKGPQP